jgi:hypothetical protein
MSCRDLSFHCKLFLEKLLVTHPVKKYPAFYVTLLSTVHLMHPSSTRVFSSALLFQKLVTHVLPVKCEIMFHVSKSYRIT